MCQGPIGASMEIDVEVGTVGGGGVFRVIYNSC